MNSLEANTYLQAEKTAFEANIEDKRTNFEALIKVKDINGLTERSSLEWIKNIEEDEE